MTQAGVWRPESQAQGPCARHDPFSDPQSPYLCNGLAVLIPSDALYTACIVSPEAQTVGIISFLLHGRPVSLISPSLGDGERAKVWLGALLGKLSRPVMPELEEVLSIPRPGEKPRQLNVSLEAWRQLWAWMLPLVTFTPWSQLFTLKNGINTPSQDGCEGSMALCTNVLTKGELSGGVNVVRIAPVWHVTLDKSLISRPPCPLLSIGCNTSLPPGEAADLGLGLSQCSGNKSSCLSLLLVWVLPGEAQPQPVSQKPMCPCLLESTMSRVPVRISAPARVCR